MPSWKLVTSQFLTVTRVVVSGSRISVPVPRPLTRLTAAVERDLVRLDDDEAPMRALERGVLADDELALGPALVVAAGQPVMALAAVAHVLALAAVEGVVTPATAEAVVVRGTGDQVGSRAPVDGVVAGATVERVVAGTAVDTVFALTALDEVVPVTGTDAVVAALAADDVIAVGADDDIGVGRADGLEAGEATIVAGLPKHVAVARRSSAAASCSGVGEVPGSGLASCAPTAPPEVTSRATTVVVASRCRMRHPPSCRFALRVKRHGGDDQTKSAIHGDLRAEPENRWTPAGKSSIAGGDDARLLEPWPPWTTPSHTGGEPPEA